MIRYFFIIQEITEETFIRQIANEKSDWKEREKRWMSFRQIILDSYFYFYSNNK